MRMLGSRYSVFEQNDSNVSALHLPTRLLSILCTQNKSQYMEHQFSDTILTSFGPDRMITSCTI